MEKTGGGPPPVFSFGKGEGFLKGRGLLKGGICAHFGKGKKVHGCGVFKREA